MVPIVVVVVDDVVVVVVVVAVKPDVAEDGCTCWEHFNKFLSALRISLLRPKFNRGFKIPLSWRTKP